MNLFEIVKYGVSCREAAKRRKGAVFIEKVQDCKKQMFDKFTWRLYNGDKKTWKGAFLFNE